MLCGLEILAETQNLIGCSGWKGLVRMHVDFTIGKRNGTWNGIWTVLHQKRSNHGTTPTFTDTPTD